MITSDIILEEEESTGENYVTVKYGRYVIFFNLITKRKGTESLIIRNNLQVHTNIRHSIKNTDLVFEFVETFRMKILSVSETEHLFECLLSESEVAIRT